MVNLFFLNILLSRTIIQHSKSWTNSGDLINDIEEKPAMFKAGLSNSFLIMGVIVFKSARMVKILFPQSK